MQSNRESQTDPETDREIFITIDDLFKLATKLTNGLSKLGGLKHPLAVRRGVINIMERAKNSETLKTSSKTYFFDIRETRDGKPFLVITESRLKGKDKKPERSSIIVFQDNAQEFSESVSRMTAALDRGEWVLEEEQETRRS